MNWWDRNFFEQYLEFVFLFLLQWLDSLCFNFYVLCFMSEGHSHLIFLFQELVKSCLHLDIEIVHFLTILRGKLLGNFICKYWRKSQSTGSLKKITVLKNTARWRKTVGTTKKQSIYYKESQVDQELIWIIREGHFWWIWWNIISFWQILIIKLSDDLFTRISDEVAYQKFWWDRKSVV